jgi:hypothetical protein
MNYWQKTELHLAGTVSQNFLERIRETVKLIPL